MLRVFHRAGPAVGALVSVGCCYMKMSEKGCPLSPTPHAGADAGGEHEWGFPMSKCVQSTGIVTGFYVREHACHSLLSYANKLRAAARAPGGDAEASLRLHGRRSVLELLLARQQLRRQQGAGGGGGGGGSDDGGGGGGAFFARVAGIKDAATIPFEEYARRSFEKCALPPIEATEWSKVHEELLQPRLLQWRRVVVYYVLRLLLAPVWESLVLIDRLLYLREHGYACSTLVPLFDPALSPRSYALVALKPPPPAKQPQKLQEEEEVVAVQHELEPAGEQGDGDDDVLARLRCWACEDQAEAWAEDAVV